MHNRLSRVFRISMAATAVSFLVLIGLCFFLAVWQARNQSMELAYNSMDSVATYLSRKFTGLADVGMRFAQSDEIADFAAGQPEERLKRRSLVRLLINNYMRYDEAAMDAYILMKDGALLSANPDSSSLGMMRHKLSLRICRDYRLELPYRTVRFTDPYIIDGKSLYAMLIPVSSNASGVLLDYSGSLFLLFDTSDISRLVADSGLPMVVTLNDIPIVSADKELLSQFEANDNRDWTMQRIPNTSWRIYMNYAPELIPRGLIRFGWLCLIFAAAAVIGFVLLGLLLYRMIVGPILLIAEQTENAQADGGQIIADSRWKQELYRLAQGINGMLRRQHDLDEALSEAQAKTYREQISFLQAQINPHFLYNGFETIRGMAAEGSIAEIREITSALAYIYRYCCKGEALVPLVKEFEVVNRYVRVVALRYGQSMNIDISLEADEEAQSFLVPRMLLQPLVENSIQHGFVHGSRREGRIAVTGAVLNGGMRLTIEDNGVGLSQELMNLYNSAEPPADTEHSHIGLANVMYRLKLLYDSSLIIKFSESVPSGLRIDILFPEKAEKTTSITEMRD